MHLIITTNACVYIMLYMYTNAMHFNNNVLKNILFRVHAERRRILYLHPNIYTGPVPDALYRREIQHRSAYV